MYATTYYGVPQSRLGRAGVLSVGGGRVRGGVGAFAERFRIEGDTDIDAPPASESQRSVVRPANPAMLRINELLSGTP